MVPSASSSMTSELSQDIIDSIVDFVAQNSARNWTAHLGRDILNCALVSRAFRYRAQFHIFEAVHIRHGTKQRAKRLEELKDIIQSNPHISISIQELYLECRDLEYAWIGEDPSFLSIMENIATHGRQLRKLTLEADKFIDDGYGVLHIPDFESLLAHFFRPYIFPFITTLVLDRLENVPVEVLEECKHLVDLELLHVELVQTKERTPTVHSLLALKRLVIRLARPPLFDTRPLDGWERALDLSQLHTYEICRDGIRDLRFEQTIIDTAGASLQALRLFSLNRELNEGMKFNGFCNLRNASGLHTLDTETHFPGDNLVSVISTLETVSGQNILRTFAITGFLEGCEPDAIMTADWQRFYSQIVRITQGEPFALSISLHYFYDGDSSDAEDEADMDARCDSLLSRLHAENVSELANLSNCTLIISYNAHKTFYD